MDMNTTYGNTPAHERPISQADESWEALPQRLRGRGDWLLKRGRIKDAELMFGLYGTTCGKGITVQSEKAENRVERTALGKLGAAIEQALDEAPVAEVLSILTGAFVGLTVELVRRQGHDVSQPIKVDGGSSRDITIHAPKKPPEFHTDKPAGRGRSSTR